MTTSTPPAKPKSRILLVLAAVGAVCVVGGGVLVTLGVHSTQRYLAQAKTAEARSTLTRILVSAARVHSSAGALCPSASAPVPSSTSAIAGKKYMSSSAEWEADRAKHAGFACLGFSLSSPQYYQVRYEASGDRVTVTATGDLDGDGETSTFIARGEVVDGNFKSSPVIEEREPLE